MKNRLIRIRPLVSCLAALVLLAVFTLNGFAGVAEGSGWEEKLKAADGVISVERIEDIDSQLFTEKYLVTFEQPLDWSDPSKGAFPQRVEVGLREDAEYNILETYGYGLMPDFFMGEDPESELPKLIRANYCNVEHRFFGESRPEGLSNDGVEYWEYYTAENAANDYHRIYTSLAPVLGHDWIATGVSRGGEMTNVYGYFFPEDMILYVPYVAPCPEGPEDPRYYRFVYTEIGNTAFGEEKAKEYRDLILTFQVELMQNKEALLPGFEANALENGRTYREGLTMDRLYDVCVMEFAGVSWQYTRYPFEDLQTILDMPEATEEEKQAKREAELKMMLNVQGPSALCVSSSVWPYFVNAATTYGQYHYDFSFLREALKAEGLEDRLSVTEDEENGILFDFVLTKEQRAAFTFDSSFRDALAESIRTTPAKHLMIFGSMDPWTATRLPDTDNPNVKVFIHPTKDHTATIHSMPEEMKEEAMAVLKEWIGEKPAAGEGAEEVTPGLSAYGYYNQEYFRNFDSGIEGAYVEPVFGELITPDKETEYKYWAMENAMYAASGETQEYAARVFAGEIRGEPGTPAQRMYDLYDTILHQADDSEADEETFMAYIAPLIDAKDPTALREAADELYLATGIHVLYGTTALQEASGKNRTLPAVSLAAPSGGEKIAYDPVAEEKFADAYRAAMGEYAKAVGLTAGEADTAEAYRMQTAFVHSDLTDLSYLFTQTRRQRTAAEGDAYSDDAYGEDLNRLSELHPSGLIVPPEGMSEADASVLRKRDYMHLDERVTRTRQEIGGMGEGAGILAALDKAGFAAGDVIVAPADLEAMKSFAITDETLSAWKLNAVLLFAEKTGFVPAACKAAAKEMNRAVDCAVWGSDTAPEKAEEADETTASSAVMNLLKQDPGLVWAQEKGYDPARTNMVLEAIEEIRKEYIKTFQANDWLKEEEKQIALTKLDRLSPVVGIPTEENYMFPVIASRAEGGTYLRNRIAIFRRDLARDWRLVSEEGFDRKYYGQTAGYDPRAYIRPNIVNAMSNPACNSILVPAGIIHFLANHTNDDFEFRSVLTFFIAHEIGHLFDDQGSIFDEYGVIRNWWSEESREHFTGIVKTFADRYTEFEFAEGLHQDFDGSYAECLADFASFRITLDILGDDLQAQERFFRALASVFCSVRSRAMLERLTNEFTTDFHPYNSLRLNAMITSVDGFYELYDVKEGDPMYVAPEDRLKLW